MRPISKYKKLKKSLLLVIAAVFFLSSFAGEIQSCICEDNIEVLTENESCCSNKTDCSDSEKKANDSHHEKQKCDYCKVCSITKQKIELPYNITNNKTISKEILKYTNESTFSVSYTNSEHIPYSGYIPDIPTRIYISVSNLRI